MMNCQPSLSVIAYHYVRDLPNTEFPRIKGLLTDRFRSQVDWLADHYEMATWESALGFLKGEYTPSRDLCLLTFDDGLKEHAREVTSILHDRRIQGLFFLPTAALEEHQVLLVHKSHFLMAALGFEDYRRAFLDHLEELCPGMDIEVDPEQACRFYRFDDAEVAQFKYLLNLRLSDATRQQLLESLFTESFSDEGELAKELYMNWNEARAMQEAGMMLGGHSHRHDMLAKLSDVAQWDDLKTCAQLIRSRLHAQDHWPFCYPYGSPDDSFNQTTVEILQELDFCCAFTTQKGTNDHDADPFQIRRIDTVDLPA